MVNEKFREVVKNRHQYAQEWKKKTGKRVMGYLCSYAPEEIIYAANILPVRIMGGHEPAQAAERYISTIYCTFCRDILSQGLKGRYDYLDGIVYTHGCLHIRQTFWWWQNTIGIPFSHYIYLPHMLQVPSARDCLLEELKVFKHSLEGFTGSIISDQDLDRAIEIYNTNRRLMKKLYEMRKADNPPISGAEVMEIVLASLCMDKEEHNKLLEQVLKEIPDIKNDNESIARLMVIGSENDDVETLRLIESLGGQVVIDDHCTGSRYLWNEVVPQEDRLAAIASKCIDRPPCPVTDLEGERRLDHVLNLAKEYNVQGAVFLQQKFCDPNEYDLVFIQRLFEKNNIRTLWLELDISSAVGPLRTRIEAFLETFMEDLI